MWSLPVVFVCENNQYALTTSYRAVTAVERVSLRAASYDMPGVTVDGNDAVEVYLVMREAIERARAGEGPSLVEAVTYRRDRHSLSGKYPDRRPQDERDAWHERDPIPRLEAVLRGRRVLSKARMAEIGSAAAAELEDAVQFGVASPEPTLETMTGAVYSPHASYAEPGPGGGRELAFVDALNEALTQEMARDEDVFVMGEDIAETGGIFGVSKGLKDAFGPERVRDTPISEATFVGCGVGATIAGKRPVVEIQIFDFVALTMDMLVNQAAKFRFMLGGTPTVPLVVRGPQGGGIRLAAQHSQSLEAWFTHVPGLVVIAPSTPYDAKGLLIAAIRDDNPVIFLEQKLLYIGPGGPVPEEPYAIPIGKADIKRAGTDATVVATAAMVPRALWAAGQLEREGISVEVVDPRTLRPLDEDTILESVRKTNRLLIVHEAWTKGGFGAEVSALVVERAFDYLDAPVARLGALDTPMPYNDAPGTGLDPLAGNASSRPSGGYSRPRRGDRGVKSTEIAAVEGPGRLDRRRHPHQGGRHHRARARGDRCHRDGAGTPAPPATVARQPRARGFALPALTPALDRLRGDLMAGRGFAILAGLPIGHLEDAEIEALY